MRIDLRSDTVTLPDAQMRAVMAAAPMGDASYGEDPSVCHLEAYCAELFGKEAALFTCSGTMSNQLAIRSLTEPGDEVIVDARHHIYHFESAQTADLARVTLNPCRTNDGILTARHLEHALADKPRSPAYSRPVLACIENTISHYGGRVFPLDTLQELALVGERRSMAIYLDGARLFNACVASGTEPSSYTRHVTALSVCFAKGLGAPFGAMLAGPRAVIDRARRFRKWYGGALHQAGAMAAAALDALRRNIVRLDEDHHHARLLAGLLADLPCVALCTAVETNIVMFDVSASGMSAQAFVDEANRHGVRLIAWTSSVVRAVTHIGIEEDDVRQAARVLQEIGERRELRTDARDHLC